MANTVGLECKAYVGSGVFASPTWVEMPSVQDTKFAFARNMAVLKSRASTVERGLPGLLKDDVDFNLLRDNANVQQAAMKTSFLAGAVVLMAFADGPIATPGTVYRKGEYVISAFEESEPLEDGSTVAVKMMPHGKSTNNPLFVTVP